MKPSPILPPPAGVGRWSSMPMVVDPPLLLLLGRLPRDKEEEEGARQRMDGLTRNLIRSISLLLLPLG